MKYEKMSRQEIAEYCKFIDMIEGKLKEWEKNDVDTIEMNIHVVANLIRYIRHIQVLSKVYLKEIDYLRKELY
jgi:hypothetical protein